MYSRERVLNVLVLKKIYKYIYYVEHEAIDIACSRKVTLPSSHVKEMIEILWWRLKEVF